jgi:hypothetical protein
MRCEDCLRRLESLFDDLLDSEDARRTRAHLAACPACSRAWEELGREQELYADYWREAQVAPPNWAAVLTRIEQDARPPAAAREPGVFARWFAPLTRTNLGRSLAAASLLFAVGVGLFTFSRLADRGTRPAPEVAANPVSPQHPRTGGSDAAVPPTEQSAGRPSGVPAVSHAPAGGDPVAAAKNAGGTSPLRASPEARAAARPGKKPVGGGGEKAVVAAPGEVAGVGDGSGRPAPAEGDEAERFRKAMTLSQTLAAARQPIDARQSPLMRAEVAQHFERMQLLFLSLKNAPAGARRADDVAYEKGLARRLFSRNALLRREAEVRGDLPRVELLDRMSPVLADIANLSPEAAPADVLSIGERIRRKGLVALLKAYSAGPGEVASREAQ